MVRHLGGLAFIGLYLGCSTQAEARELVELSPSSPWSIDYAEESCALLRRFGSGEDEVYLELRQGSPGDEFRITVGGKDLHKFGFHPTPQIKFEPDEQFRTEDLSVSYLEFEDGKLGMNFWLGLRKTGESEDASPQSGSDSDETLHLWPEEARARREAEITHLRIEGAFWDDYRLNIGSMKAPMNAMRACMDELLSHWGIDVEAHRNLMREAAPSEPLGKWFSSGDYPEEMRRRGYMSDITFRITVGADGKPEDCAITTSTSPPDFSERTCELMMKRAQFDPALDAQGKPIRSYYAGTIHWKL